MHASEERILNSFTSSLDNAERHETPYRHWFLSKLFPGDVLEDLLTLDFPIGDLEGVSGKRELHNDTRHYFDQENIGKFPVIADISNTFQAPETVAAIEKFFETDLEDTFLRIEYAQDVDGFWLEPHTDLGVKRLTVLIFLSDGPGHDDLGTDIFSGDKEPLKRAPFKPNLALAFVPGDNTYHGFQKRKIEGVRKSLILNYVTKEWRDREQLAFPHQTVTSSLVTS